MEIIEFYINSRLIRFEQIKDNCIIIQLINNWVSQLLISIQLQVNEVQSHHSIKHAYLKIELKTASSKLSTVGI